jgi:hypothetical protein
MQRTSVVAPSAWLSRRSYASVPQDLWSGGRFAGHSFPVGAGLTVDRQTCGMLLLGQTRTQMPAQSDMVTNRYNYSDGRGK